jgi:polysaccharide deacetylase family protein (PEP-CTERM system associated)
MNILTFDIEDWFHILDNESTKTEKQWKNFESRLEYNMDKIFKVLDDNKQDATFFCLGWVARKHPKIIKKINDLGYEIATHSDLHQLAYELDKNQFAQDLELSIKSIEDITGKKITTYRAPGFSIKEENLWVFDELLKQGIEKDCSVFSAKRSHGGLSEFRYAEPAYIERELGRLKEFPINLHKVFGKNIIFSGGGYFRLIPYPILKHFMNNSSYVMTYFHPRDFDAEQPMISDLNLIRKFKSYYGLSNSLNKLERLIQDFDFISLKKADLMIDWTSVKSIKFQEGFNSGQHTFKRKSTLY